MDSNGRLHMPGFVGDTFEETGVLKEREEAGKAPAIQRRERQLAAEIARMRAATAADEPTA